ncbi:hypothetical protein B0H17DRAFT_833397, partial [Mycena rosella]
ALYDSAKSFPQPRCHPETRADILNDLYRWATVDDSIHSIIWLHGPAGAGKSAIMQTLCQRLQNNRCLGGAFFFKRGHTTRGNAKVLFATLAYQLALHHSHLKPIISQTVDDGPSVVGRDMAIQIRKLMIEPCTSLKNSAPLTFLIDGLDECEGDGTQQKLLCLLGNAASEPHHTLRILVASRPEPQIHQAFQRPGLVGHHHALNIEQSFTDVRNYLRSEFDRIHREHAETMFSVPAPWPTEPVLEELVTTSSGYFIYAATIIKFIDDADFRPIERLSAVIQNLPTECGTPFHALDELYSQILRGIPFRSRVLNILCVIVHGGYFGMLQPSRVIIEKLLGLDLGDVALTLRRLHSILLMPQDDTQFIQLHHKSFRDFLLDPNRSGNFYIG